MEVLEYKDIKGLDRDTLESRLWELKREVFFLKMQKKTSGIEKPHVFSLARKNIARLATHKKELEKAAKKRV